MAMTSRNFRPNVDFDIHTDNSHEHANPSSSGNRFAVLGDLPLNNIQNIKPSTLDTLTTQFSSLQIHNSASRENEFVQPQVSREQARRVRLSVDSNIESHQSRCDNTRVASRSSNGVSSGKSANFQETNNLALASIALPSNKEQLAKHQEGQFEWLLSLPIRIAKSAAKGRRSLGRSRDDEDRQAQGEKQLLFGCNLVHHRAQPGNGDKPVDTYTLLATRIEHEEEESVPEEAEVMEDTLSVVANTSHDSFSTMNYTWEQFIQLPEPMRVQKISETLAGINVGDDNHDTFPAEQHVERHLSVSPQPPPTRPLSRIEDSVEELDKLEEQLEAVEEVVALERVFSPELDDDESTEVIIELAPAPVVKPAGVKRPLSVGAMPTSSSLRTRNSITSAERTSLVRRSMISYSRDDDDKPSSSSASSRLPSAKPTPTTTKKTAPRPSSLLPSKATTKSSKTPTAASFELPGEAVARRLKEQRAARLSQSQSHDQPLTLSSSKSVASPSKIAPTAKSTKPLTRPQFELPGETISRRKREEREVKLRQMEEEERKRREFRARPMPTSVKAPGGLSRETMASQARKAEVSPLRQKRESLLGGTTPRVTMSVTTSGGGGGGGSTRGRVNVPATSESRGISSNSSSGVRRSQIGSLKGKEVFRRDGEYAVERERERKEREEAAKLARKEAAERSREMGREWREKQQRKRMSMMSVGDGLA